MSIRCVTAKMECDACGTTFEVRLDPADKAPDSIADAVDEEIRTLFEFSIQHDMHLCDSCTKKADAIGDEDYQPTREEILQAVGAIDD